MPPPSEPRTEEPPPSKESEFDLVNQEIASIKKQIEEEERGIVGFSKRWGIVVAFVVSLIAIPRAVVDLRNLISSKPDTTLTKGSALGMAYDPSGRAIEFDFDLAVANSGTKADVISELDAKLVNLESPSSEFVPFTTTDFNCASQGAHVPIPFSVGNTLPTSLSCSITAKLADLSYEGLRHPGPRRLAVHLTSESHRIYPIDFCFSLTDETITGILNSKRREKRRFLFSNCD